MHFQAICDYSLAVWIFSNLDTMKETSIFSGKKRDISLTSKGNKIDKTLTVQFGDVFLNFRSLCETGP